MSDFKPFFIMLSINLMLFVGGLSNNLDGIDAFGEFNTTSGSPPNSTFNQDPNNFDDATFVYNETNAPEIGGAGDIFATIFIAKDVIISTVVNQIFNPISMFANLGFPGIFSIVAGILLMVLNIYAVLRIIIG